MNKPKVTRMNGIKLKAGQAWSLTARGIDDWSMPATLTGKIDKDGNWEVIEDGEKTEIGFDSLRNVDYRLVAPTSASASTEAKYAATAEPGARKNDAEKCDLSLVPVEAMEGIARAMMYGAKKYSRGNYRLSGMDWTRLAAACARHLFAWLFGEDLDQESGLSHIDHAQASLAMLAFQMRKHPENDNRGGK